VTIAQFTDFKKSLGITNSVLTHGLSYGNDCTLLKAFVPELGHESTKAVGVIDPDSTSDDEMLAMNAAGVRGLRVNLYRYKTTADVALKEALKAHAQRIANLSLPWSLTMTTIHCEFWDELEPFIQQTIAKDGIQLITDHFALLKAPSMLPVEYQSDPTKQPDFEAIMRLVRAGTLWVKLSAP
jgi:predicted TIM-barrel fold metal-dependent hydrolase